MKKLSLKKQLELSHKLNSQMLATTIELVRCSIGDTMTTFITNKEDFKYNKENIESMFKYVSDDMYWYKEQIETCFRKSFEKPEIGEQLSSIVLEHAQEYVNHMRKGLLRKASRLKAKEKNKKGTLKNEARVRPRTKRKA